MWDMKGYKVYKWREGWRRPSKCLKSRRLSSRVHFRPPALSLCPTHHPWIKTLPSLGFWDTFGMVISVWDVPMTNSPSLDQNTKITNSKKSQNLAMDKGQNKIRQKSIWSHLNIFYSLSIPSFSSPSQKNPKYLVNEQSRIWKAQKSIDEMKSWAKVEWDLPPGSCIIMSYHPEPSTIPIYAHHSDPHENIVNCIFSTGIYANA